MHSQILCFVGTSDLFSTKATLTFIFTSTAGLPLSSLSPHLTSSFVLNAATLTGWHLTVVLTGREDWLRCLLFTVRVLLRNGTSSVIHFSQCYLFFCCWALCILNINSSSLLTSPPVPADSGDSSAVQTHLSSTCPHSSAFSFVDCTVGFSLENLCLW